MTLFYIGHDPFTCRTWLLNDQRDLRSTRFQDDTRGHFLVLLILSIGTSEMINFLNFLILHGYLLTDILELISGSHVRARALSVCYRESMRNFECAFACHGPFKFLPETSKRECDMPAIQWNVFLGLLVGVSQHLSHYSIGCEMEGKHGKKRQKEEAGRTRWLSIR